MKLSATFIKILIRYDIEKSLTSAQKETLYRAIEEDPEVYLLWKEMHEQHSSDTIKGRAELLKRNDPLIGMMSYYKKKVKSIRFKLAIFITVKSIAIAIGACALYEAATKKAAAPAAPPPVTKQQADIKGRISILWYKPNP